MLPKWSRFQQDSQAAPRGFEGYREALQDALFGSARGPRVVWHVNERPVELGDLATPKSSACLCMYVRYPSLSLYICVCMYIYIYILILIYPYIHSYIPGYMCCSAISCLHQAGLLKLFDASIRLVMQPPLGNLGCCSDTVKPNRWIDDLNLMTNEKPRKAKQAVL